MNEIQSILNVRSEIENKINFVKNLVNEPVSYKGRLFYHLIDENPIQAALETIEMHQEFDLTSLENELENAENDLATFLNSNKKDPEVEEVIQEIFKSNNMAFKRMQNRLTNINLDKTRSVISLDNLPNDILFIIFTKSGVYGLGKLMQASKFFHNFSMNQEFWKYFTLEENPELYDQLPILKSINNKKLNWKQIFYDSDINMERSINRKMVYGFKIDEKNDGKIISRQSTFGSWSDVSYKLSIINIKRNIIKTFKLKCNPNDFKLIWNNKNTLKEYDFFIIKNPFSGEVVKSDYLDYYFNSDSYLKGLIDDTFKYPEEWILEDNDRLDSDELIEDENKCKCQCIMF